MEDRESNRECTTGGDRSRSEQVYGRALGRVLAHELYHIFARTCHHGQEGVAKTALSGKALISERSEGRTRYRALVSRADYVQGESQGLLDRLFGGELAPLVAHYAKHRNLSADEVRRLKRLIEDFDNGD